MTRKDYIKFANALKAEKPGKNWDANKHIQWRLDVEAVAGVLASDNPQFDRQRFLDAAGVETISGVMAKG